MRLKTAPFFGLRAAGLGALGLVLASCGSGGDSAGNVCAERDPPFTYDNFGKGFIERLSKQNGNHSTKERHPGIEWIGADPANLLRASKFLHEFA